MVLHLLLDLGKHASAVNCDRHRNTAKANLNRVVALHDQIPDLPGK